MHCWKTVKIDQLYGDWQLLGFSLITVLISFTLLFLPLSFLLDIQNIRDDNFLIFLTLLLALYPLHKVVHLITLYLLKAKVVLLRKKLYRWRILVTEPMKKEKYMVALLMPFFLLNSVLLIFLFIFPNYFHYISFLLASHIGVCVPDFIYLKSMIKSPVNCLIEESDDGYEILRN
ncbi:DUF3267 domain-containing protein [Fervidibacillus halotolerans]|uniref:DUF3267 domain-containing protein n=1 Tax=Fervidibacillus halotolerans TaxID=2980027 RepID=A0A9E8M0N8_9BACI|nr:DUF3267 domain-containing protein [Fervidibacillus halotolerans]WAA13011.1 DUF3267 domain-containing protein [Fervidibacillus halotolerans]